MTNRKEVKPIESDQLVILKNAVAMAKYDLSRNQQKVFLEVAMLAKNRPDEKFYKLYIREFLNNIGVSTNDTAELKREIEEMRNITIHIPKTKRGGELKANFFASVEIFENQGSRFIEIELSEKLKPYFIEIAEGDFFHYQIENTRVLKSAHSIRMYLLLKKSEWVNKTTIRYDELRGYLGVKEGDYKLFGDFKRRVLDKCQDELKQKTDIAFEYLLIRERPNNPNTPVHKIAFTIQRNGKTPTIIEVPLSPQIVIPLTIEPDQELTKLAHDIEKIDVNELATLIGNYGRDRVHDVLLLAKEQAAKGIKILSLTAYLHNAIKNNSAQGKARKQVDRKTSAQLTKTHIEIETTIKHGIFAFTNDYYTSLGMNAPIDKKTEFLNILIERIAKRELRKQDIYDGETLKQETVRYLYGYEFHRKSEDELAVLFMKSINKPVIKEKGFWKYV
ncbi:replication initiation protein [Nostoc sp. CHAB 5834]|nr:replication initiation protein [Nostoc sp. CHAB 5834]